jgi:hypothetical protein
MHPYSGLATALHPNYMRAVEQAMASGLDNMRLISSLLTVNDQGLLSLERLNRYEFIVEILF